MKRAKGPKGRADALFSQLIRSRGACEGCGESRYDLLQTCHIVSRRFSALRCDPENAVCGCASCHRRWTANPLEFADFVRNRYGAERVRRLQEKARPTKRMDWEQVCVELKALLAELEEEVA